MPVSSARAVQQVWGSSFANAFTFDRHSLVVDVSERSQANPDSAHHVADIVHQIPHSSCHAPSSGCDVPGSLHHHDDGPNRDFEDAADDSDPAVHPLHHNSNDQSVAGHGDLLGQVEVEDEGDSHDGDGAQPVAALQQRLELAPVPVEGIEPKRQAPGPIQAARVSVRVCWPSEKSGVFLHPVHGVENLRIEREKVLLSVEFGTKSDGEHSGQDHGSARDSGRPALCGGGFRGGTVAVRRSLSLACCCVGHFCVGDDC